MKNVHLLPTDKPTRLFYDISLDKLILATAAEVSKWFDNKHIYITSSDEEIKEGDYGLDTFHKETRKFRNKNFVTKYDKKIILTTDQDLIKDGVQAIDDEFLEWFVKNPSCEKVNVEIIPNSSWGFDLDEPMVLGYKIIIPQEEPKQEDFEYVSIGEERIKIPIQEPKQEYQSECICENSCRGFVNVKCKQINKKETVGEVAERLTKDFPHYSVRDNMDDSDIKGWFLEALQKGAKWQAEKDRLDVGLLQIELNHTKTLLASCEKALEDRDNQTKKMYSEEETYRILHSLMMEIQLNGLLIDDDTDLKNWFEQFKKKQ